MNHVISTRTLNDGHGLPPIGFGTWPLAGEAATTAVTSAIEVGYRLIDTAYNYGNEAAVGRGIAQSGTPRDQLVVTTKLPGRHHGFTETLDSFEESRSRLGLDVVDLYLIHWPNPGIGRYVDSWRAMVELRSRGLVRSIGVSNFAVEHLVRLADETGELPAVNQIELHPYFSQQELRDFHEANQILTEAWSPLGQGSGLLDEPVLRDIAAAHGVHPGQVVLRWHLQIGSVPIPKASSRAHQAANLDLQGFALDEQELAAIGTLQRGRLGGDPLTHEEL